MTRNGSADTGLACLVTSAVTAVVAAPLRELGLALVFHFSGEGWSEEPGVQPVMLWWAPAALCRNAFRELLRRRRRRRSVRAAAAQRRHRVTPALRGTGQLDAAGGDPSLPLFVLEVDTRCLCARRKQAIG